MTPGFLALAALLVAGPGAAAGFFGGASPAARAGGERVANPLLLADPAMQVDIARTVEALNAASGETERRHVLENARELAGHGPEQRVRLLEQLEIFLAGAAGTEQAMGGAILLHALEFDREEIMAATLPHMVGAAPALHKVLREVAATAVDPDREDDPISLVLEAERLRLGEAGEPGAEAAPERLGALLGRLARDDSPWVRRYATGAGGDASPLSPRPDVRD